MDNNNLDSYAKLYLGKSHLGQDVQETENVSKRVTTGRNLSFSSSKNKNIDPVKEYIKFSSKQLPDPFSSDYKNIAGEFQIIEPLVNFSVLAKIVYENSYLLQCIIAMVQNVHGYGYRLEKIGNDGEDISINEKEVSQELAWFEELFDQFNGEESFLQVRKKLGFDKEVFNNAYIEIVRDSQGKVITGYHVPAASVRLTKQDIVATPVTYEIKRQGKKIKIASKKNFRRFVQIKGSNYAKVYYKEFGDPRTIDPRTGKENPDLTSEQAATEIIHITEYNSRSVYGLPIWYTQLPSILGSRESEHTNQDFFQNNAIPAMAIMVSGGHLTNDTMDVLDQLFRQVKGREVTNKIILMEARGAPEDANNSSVPTPHVELKPLQAERQQDALFQKYEEACRDKIRASFRLAPVIVGSANDYTFASAAASLEVCEAQVFSTARNDFDEIINSKILSTWNPKYFRFKSNVATLSTSEDMIKAVKEFSIAGAITPNTAIELLNSKLNTDIPLIKKWWGDIPMNLVQSIFRSTGTEDKSNFIINVLKTINEENIDELKNFVSQTRGNSDEIFDPENDPNDAKELESLDEQ